MSDGTATSTARWLLAFVLVLVLYGSLFPFELKAGVAEVAGPLDLLSRLTWNRSTPGDVFANLLLYVPLGAALAWALPARVTGLVRLLLAVACGFALSLAVELTQVFLRTRVAALSDLSMNTAGTAIGAAGALVIRALADRLQRSEAFRLTREPFAVALVIVWLASFLPPWLPRFDTSKWPELWTELLGSGWPEPHLVAVEAIGWLVVAAALRALTRPAYVWFALLVLALGALTVQFTLFVRFADVAQPAGALVALLAWPLLARLDDARLTPLLFVALAVVIAWRGLEPFQFDGRGQPFNWVPFHDLISRGSTGFNLPLFFGKAFTYGALVWLLVRRGAAPAFAGAFVAAFLLAIEALQVFTPPGHHVASITDPLVAIASGVVLALLQGTAGTARHAPAPGTVRRRRRRT